MKEIPQWAIDRVLAVIADAKWHGGTPWTANMIRKDGADEFKVPYAVMALAFAKYIAEHEEPPVDPLLDEAREIVARHNDYEGYEWSAQSIREGNATGARFEADMKIVLLALRRGIELAKEKSDD